MLGGEFSSVSWQSLESGLQLLALRQRLLSNNVANANSPGYKRADLPFKQIMAQAMNGQSSHSPANVHSLIVQDNRTAMKPDGNNVDVEMEMVHLAENNLTYQAAITALNFRINNLRMAISEGRKG